MCLCVDCQGLRALAIAILFDLLADITFLAYEVVCLYDIYHFICHSYTWHSSCGYIPLELGINGLLNLVQVDP